MSAELDGKTIIELGGSEFIFPLPDTISYQTAYGWEKVEFGIIGNVLSSAVNGNIKSGAMKDAGLAQMMQTNLFATGDIKSKREGIAVNPKESVLFKGVSHREYSLAFKIAGKSAGEVRDKLTFVGEMQAKAAPSLESQDIFFSYPETGTLSIVEGSTDILKERKIAVSSIDWNLTPDGFYATWSDGTPLSFALTLGIIELQLPTKDNDKGMFS